MGYIPSCNLILCFWKKKHVLNILVLSEGLCFLCLQDAFQLPFECECRKL